MTEKLFTTYDIAQLMEASPLEVNQWMQQGALPYMRLPNGPIRISRSGLGLFLKSRGLESSGLLEEALTDHVESTDPIEPTRQTRATRPPTSSVKVAAPNKGRIDPPIDLSDDEGFLYEMPGQPGKSEADDQVQTPDTDYQPVPAAESQAERSGPAQPIELPDEPDQADQSDQADESIAADLQPICPADQIAEALLAEAVSRRATHIHLQPEWNSLTLRLRIDSVLQTIESFSQSLPPQAGPEVIESLKRLSGLAQLRSTQPQSASFTFAIEDRDVECVLSTWPTRKGTRLTIQLVDTDRPVVGFDQLGLAREDAALLSRKLSEPCGMILVAGLPRSGRCTTLNAMVQRLNGPGRNIITIEKTAEIAQPGVNQSSIAAELEIELADALRAVGRQDADVIMVQELTDAASAKEAMNLSLQGRLVLAGLYADSGPDAIASLGQMGLDSWSLSKSLLAVITPWAVRRLCHNCRTIIVPDDALLGSLGLSRSDLTFPIFGPTGCRECHQSGYAGRTGCYSIIDVDRDLAEVIRQGASVAEIERTALQNGTHSLAESAMNKVAEGITSLEEIARVLPHQLFVRARS